MSTAVYGAHEAKVYFIEETNYGETPSGTGQPAMVAVGIVQDVEPALTQPGQSAWDRV